MNGLTQTFALAGTIGFCPPDDVFDHLGSVRAVIDGDTGTVLEASDYYPFGKRIPSPAAGAVPVTEPVEVTAPVEATAVTAPTSPNLRHFSGKESQSFLSASIPLLDFGARMYDPITARWTAQDPLAEEYYAVSPYVCCLVNPILFIDTDGRKVRLDQLSNTNHQVALQRFMMTKTGKQFLLRFMSKGENIALGSERIIATDNGDRHKDALWIYSNHYDDKSIKGQSCMYIKSSEGNLLNLGRDGVSLTDVESVKNGVMQVIYLNDDMSADESTAVLGHEAFDHIKTNSDYLTNSDNGNLNNEHSVHSYLTKYINADDDHNALTNGKCVDYKAFIYEICRLLSNNYYLKYYNDDVKNHK